MNFIICASSQVPTDRKRRYRLWYMGKPVVKLWTEKRTFHVLQILAGQGKPFITYGGGFLDAVLCQEIEELFAEPVE